MARPKSEFLRGWGKAFEVFKAIVDAVLALGGSDTDLERIITNKGLRTKIAQLIVSTKQIVLQFVDRTVRVAIHGTQTLAQYLASGAYDWVNEDIKKCWILSRAVPDGKQEAILLYYNKSMTSQEVLDDMERQGLRPGTDRELLELGVQHPDLQRKFPIVELGTMIEFSGGQRVLFLYGLSSVRFLYLDWFGSDWYGYCRFISFRKEDLGA